MTKKKIIAIILFLFLSLFMFTFANPGDIKPELKKPEPTKKEEVKDDTNTEDTTETVVSIVDNVVKKKLAAPVIEIDNDRVVILLGESYDVMTGVKVISEENLTATADINDTSKLTEGTYTITYTVTDSEGNTATATRVIVVLDPNKDNDDDGFTNGEEIKEETNPEDEDSFPTTLEVDPKEVKIIKGKSYDVMTGVVVKGDKNNQGLEATPSLTDTATLALGTHKVTYTVKDNYNKTLTDERTISVVSDVNHNNVPDDEETYTLTVNYVYEDGTEAAPSYTNDVLQGRMYWAMSPIIDGYVADTFIVAGIMPKHDKDVTVTYSVDANGDLIPDKYQGKLTITYVMDDGGEAPQTYERYYLKGAIYVVRSPRVSGYIVDRAVVYGTMNGDSKEEIVNYYRDANGDNIPDKDQRRLIVTYVMDDGTEAPEPYEKYYLIGEDYSFDVPAIDGYMSYEHNFSGTMGDTDVEKTVRYYKDVNGDNIPDKFQGVLTINYVMEDGSTAPDPYVEYYNRGQYYYVTIPAIEGYVASRSSVSGWMNASSKTVTVTYYVDSNNDGVADRYQGKLTINYVMEDGTTAPAPYVNYYSMNRSYSVESPVIDGYVASQTVVSGRMTRRSITETVTYYVDSNNDGVADRYQGKLTINYVMDDGTEAPEPYVNYYSMWENYSVEVPTIDGYVADQTTVSGRMMRRTVTATVTYYVDANGDNIPDKYQATLKINYVTEDGQNTPAAYEQVYLKSSNYSVTSPAIPGYVIEEGKEVISGTITSDITETVNYYIDANGDSIPDKDQATLKINYVTEDGQNTPVAYEQAYLKSSNYSVTSPAIPGYVIEEGKEVISGTITSDITETVNYYIDANGDSIPDKDQATLKINYVTEDGQNTPAAYEQVYLKSSNYSVTSPAIPGYVIEEGKEVISGTITSDITETVNYYIDANGDGIPDYSQKVLLTFVSDLNGSVSELSQVSIYKNTKLKDQNITLPTINAGNNYTFLGWSIPGNENLYSNNELLDLSFDSNTTVTALYTNNNNGAIDLVDEYAHVVLNPLVMLFSLNDRKLIISTNNENIKIKNVRYFVSSLLGEHRYASVSEFENNPNFGSDFNGAGRNVNSTSFEKKIDVNILEIIYPRVTIYVEYEVTDEFGNKQTYSTVYRTLMYILTQGQG